MIQFNINRFGRLVKWSLTNDKGFYLKQGMTMFVVFTLLFLFFTTSLFTFRVNDIEQNYVSCFISVMIAMMITVITGPSWMFSSEKGKHERQALLMLPASNFEKYLMRYSTWIILLPLYIVGTFAADLIQYLVNVVAGNEGVTFVTTEAIENISNTLKAKSVPRYLWHGTIATGLFLHSVYALGGTFFRSHKFAWMLTTTTIIVFFVLFIWLLPEGTGYSDKDSHQVTIGWDVFYCAWLLLNFWLSYKLFCRQQVIGKFVNL